MYIDAEYRKRFARKSALTVSAKKLCDYKIRPAKSNANNSIRISEIRNATRKRYGKPNTVQLNYFGQNSTKYT